MVQTQFTWRYGGHQVFLCGSFNSERIQMSLIEGSGTTFQRTINLPPGCYQGSSSVDPHIASSEIEMDVFGQVLSIHLLSSTAYELIPISGKVAVLDVDVDVEQAFHVMYQMGLMLVPLRDENHGDMAGMLTASDFILILLQLHRNRTMFSNQELEIQTVSSWKSWKLQNHIEFNGTLVPLPRRPLIHAGPDESLGDVASRILQNNICSVPIMHSENGSCPRLIHLACLAGILENICRHIKNHLGYLPLLQQPVGFLAIGTWAIEVRRVLEVTGEVGRIRYRTCTRSDSLYWVMELLSAPDVRRVIAVLKA